MRLLDKILGRKEFICQKCGYIARSGSELGGHMGRHSKAREDKYKGATGKYPCKQCGFKAKSPQSLGGHVRSAHKK